MAKTVKVEIYDQFYNLRGDLDEAYVKELALFVDEKMRTVDSMRVAVLAALNIADELHSLRERHSELESDLRQRTERCLTLVEQALKSA